MRSSRSLPLAALLAAAGCGSDTNPSCDGSFLRYDNFGAPVHRQLVPRLP